MITKHFFWIGGVTAAVATGLYVFFGPTRKRKSKKKDVCPGLDNFGNSCFLNAILQALASCPTVSRWLKDLMGKQDDAGDRHLASTLNETLKAALKIMTDVVCIASYDEHQDKHLFQISKLLNKAVHDFSCIVWLLVLNNETEELQDTHYPASVLNALRVRRWVISPEEQDAHELFHVLTQTLDEETARYPRVVSLFDVASIENKSLKYQPLKIAITKSGGLLPVLPHRGSDLPFRGLLASQLHCIECGYRNPVRYDLFDSLSLSIPSSVWGSQNLEGLLQHFISAETVQNVECPGCAKLKHPTAPNTIKVPLPRSTFCKKLTIGKLPQCLCFHVQRTQWLDNGMPVKRYEHISFPEILHMDDFVYTKSARKDLCSGNNGLVGGEDKLLFRNTHNTRMTSGPVNLLRALNYDSNVTRNGLFLQPSLTSLHLPNIHSDVNHNGPNILKVASSEFTYKLSAVVVHLGDAMSGHFVTYRRSPSTVQGERKKDRWLYCSDTTVKVVDLEDVLQTEAYMMLYERL